MPVQLKSDPALGKSESQKHSSALSSIASFYGNSSSDEEDDEEEDVTENATVQIETQACLEQVSSSIPNNISDDLPCVQPTPTATASSHLASDNNKGENDNASSNATCITAHLHYASAVVKETKNLDQVPAVREISLEFGNGAPNPKCGIPEIVNSEMKNCSSSKNLESASHESDSATVNQNQSFKEPRPDLKQPSEMSEDSEKDSDTSDVDSSDMDTDPLSDSDDDDKIVTKFRNAPRVKGESRLCDLPPIEDLHISVPHEKCKPIGVVKSFVDPLVIVVGDVGSPALDLDSVLFLDEGDRALGKIFDVFGQVREPHYCVRFNSKDHADSFGIKPGMQVYCAPGTPHTSFVFINQLRQLRGTDASWEDDIEPPDQEKEFSDDETEKFAKKGGRRRIRVRGKPCNNSDLSVGASSLGEESETPANSSNSNGRKRHFNQWTDSNPRIPGPNSFVPTNVPGFRPYPPYARGPSGFRFPPMGFRHPNPFQQRPFHGTYNPRHNFPPGFEGPYNDPPRWSNWGNPY